MRRILLILLAFRPAWAEPTSNQQSSRDSTEQSSKDSSRDSSNDGKDLLTTVGLVLVTRIAIGAGSVRGRDRAQDEQRLAAYLEANDRALTRDLLLTRGPLLDGWLDELGLDATEATRFKRHLEGPTQAALLRAVQSPHARDFAQAFRTALAQAVGPTRMGQIERHLLGG